MHIGNPTSNDDYIEDDWEMQLAHLYPLSWHFLETNIHV